jgi:alpha-N-arabinofuranosidase
MGSKEGLPRTVVHFLLLIVCIASKCLAASGLNSTQMVTLKVDASPKLARKIPDTFLGVFFEVMLFLAIHQVLWLIIGSIQVYMIP